MKGSRFKLNQNHAPIHEALETFRRMRVVPFDVPGHKRGRGNPELTEFLGQKCVGVDVNSMKPLDNLCHPVSVIREAEELAADAFGAAHAFLMVGGTTSSVQTMVLTACKRGDEIILPRNVHRSVLNALVLCGAIPVYVNPEVDQRLGISLGMKREQVEKAIKEHPKAVAVLVNNPTYYGICSDLRAIVKMAHDAGMLCLADEAHGTHFYFGGGLPVSAMAAGADMAAVSMHKSGGSLTQSSLLLTGPDVHAGYVRQIINLTQTTSGSYLLMSSLDISRRNLAQRGRQIFHQVADMAEYAREEINAIGGYYAFGKELVNGDSVFDFDITKLSVHTLDIGLAGIEVYDILRDEYDIQIEFGDIGNILAYLSIGDRAQEVERLVSALAEIRRRFQTDGSGLLSQEYIDPQVVTSPQDAFYADKCSLPLRETEGKVCSEFVMCYPPGIPILAPGERITAVIPISKFEEGQYLMMATRKGLVKKTPIQDYANVRKIGLAAISLRDDDELIEVKATDDKKDIILVTKYGQCIRFKESDVRSTGRVSMGVRGINLLDGDEVVAMQLNTQGYYLLVVSENGMGKRTSISEFTCQNRGGKGVKCYKITEKTGNVIGAKAVNEENEIMMITTEGIIIRLQCSDISILGRITSGVKLINLSDGVTVASFAKVREKEEDKNSEKTEESSENVSTEENSNENTE